MSAKLLVFAGVPPCGIHLSGGEASLPSQEYFAGIGCPSEKAGLVIWRFITFWGLGLSAPPVVTEQPSIAVANNTFICAFMVQFYSAAQRWERKIIHHSACAWSREAALWSASSDASGFRRMPSLAGPSLRYNAILLRRSVETFTDELCQFANR